MAQGILRPRGRVYLADAATAVGHEEGTGPLGDYFDHRDFADDTFGKDTWEKAESEMQRIAANILLSRRKLSASDIDYLFAGDLLNQCTASGYGLLSFDIPYFGLYGACSTAAEGLLLGALTVGAYGGRAMTVASSHFCSAERQFRFPMEYGSQRPPTAQWTVTGAGVFLLSDRRQDSEGVTPYICEVMPGIAVDRGITDANNMGAAMAPAVVSTLTRYFRESGKKPSDFDGIFTGDLGSEGSSLLLEFMQEEGYDIRGVQKDCGCLIYDAAATDKHAGASGCGCSATVLAGYVRNALKTGAMSDILFVGTGALLSPMSVQQGQSIPGVAHLVRITTKAEEV